MWVTLHAVGMLAMPAVTVAVLLLGKRRKPTSSQASFAILAAGLVLGATLMLNAHMCRDGDPIRQCLMGSLFIFIVMAYLDSRLWRHSLAVGFTLLTLVLANHYVDLVHDRQWHGHSGRIVVYDVLSRSHLKSIQQTLAEQFATDETAYEEGELKSLPIYAMVSDELGDAILFEARGRPVWHSVFTGLYRLEKVPLSVWYPGGNVAEAVDGIELRVAASDAGTSK